jgi:Carbohydrate-binding module family 5/12
MGMTFRTSGPWGTGSASNLTPAQVDQNFWQIIQDIAAKAVPGVGISEFLIEGDQMSVVLSDHSVLGPYQLPTAQLTFQGEWIPNNAYLANDIITHGGATYMVLMDHTSEATFDPGATDGLGSDWYGLLLNNPALTVASGGGIGMTIFKATAADYSMRWGYPTLAGLHDVQQTPGPSVGDVLTWNGHEFSYTQVAAVKLVELADVAPSPPPNNGDSVTWDETLELFTFRPRSAGNLLDMPDVMDSPPPNDSEIMYYNAAAGQFGFKLLSLADLTDVDDDLKDQPFTGGNIGYGDVLTFRSGQWTGIPIQPFFDWSNTNAINLATPIPNSYISGGRSGSYIGGGTTQTIIIHKGSDVFGLDAWGDPIEWGQVTYKIRQNDTTIILDADTGVTLHPPPGRLAQPRCHGSLIQITYYNETNGGVTTTDHWAVDGDLAYDVVNVSATGGSVDAWLDTEIYKVTPTADSTYTCSTHPTAKRMVFVITTSGTTSRTLTFGSGFRSAGTLVTGSVSGKVFTVAFLGDGSAMIEISRTAAM